MEPSKNCVDLVKRYEGLRLDAYRDVGGLWTIGYGHTEGPIPAQCTEQQANFWLLSDLQNAAFEVEGCLEVDVNQNRFDALCSFTFNVGVRNLLASHLLQLINGEQYNFAGGEFEKWDHVGHLVVAGLLARRQAERVLFETPEA